MRTAGIRELKENASELVRLVREDKQEVAITYRGKVVARLVPADDAEGERRASPETSAAFYDVGAEAGDLRPNTVSDVDTIRERPLRSAPAVGDSGVGPRASSMTLADLRRRRQGILQLAERYGAHDVRVFGSTARGEARPGSDVDLLVAFNDASTLLDAIALEQDLEDLLGCPVEVVEESSLHRLIRASVLADAVPL